MSTIYVVFGLVLVQSALLPEISGLQRKLIGFGTLIYGSLRLYLAYREYTTKKLDNHEDTKDN